MILPEDPTINFDGKCITKSTSTGKPYRGLFGEAWSENFFSLS